MVFALGCGGLVDGEHLATPRSENGAASNYVMKFKRVQTFDGVHKGSFSRDGSRLAVVDQNYAEIISPASGQKLSRLAPRDSTFLGISFSPDARLLASALRSAKPADSLSIRVSLLEAESGKERLTLPTIDDDWRRPVDDLSFSPDGRLLVSNIGGIARQWDVTSGKEVQRFVPETGPKDQQAERALLSSDGNLLAVYFISPTKSEYKTVHIWNLETGQQKEFETEIYLDWRFSGDSKLLVLTAITDKGKPTERSVAEIWDAVAASRLKVIELPKDWRGAYTVAFSPDSRLLAIGGYRKFGIFSVDTGELLASETHHSGGLWQDSEMPNRLNHVEFSPDAKLLLTSGNDNTVKLWSIERR